MRTSERMKALNADPEFKAKMKALHAARGHVHVPDHLKSYAAKLRSCGIRGEELRKAMHAQVTEEVMATPLELARAYIKELRQSTPEQKAALKAWTEQRAAASLTEGAEAMGIAWMEWRELAESIPPAYTEWIGGQYAAQLERAA